MQGSTVHKIKPLLCWILSVHGNNRRKIKAFESPSKPKTSWLPAVQRADSREMSLHRDRGYFPLAWCSPFCMLRSTMQIPQGAHAKTQSLALSLSHSFLPHTFSLSPSLTLWMFTLWRFPLVECTPALLFLLPSFLSPFPLCHLLSSIASHLTRLAVTLDFKALLHSSVTHKREGYSVLR